MSALSEGKTRMLRIFYGENREGAERQIKALLGESYEVFEGENLTETDLPSIFQGASLFEAGKRRILLKNLTENNDIWAKIADYATTEHDVIIWEPKIDKRSTTYKALKAAGVEMQEFATFARPDAGAVFGILDLALRNGEKAIREVEKIENEQDPYMFFGLMVTQALKKFQAVGGAKERRVLKELAKLDMQMKTSALDPWMLVKSFLIRVSDL